MNVLCWAERPERCLSSPQAHKTEANQEPWLQPSLRVQLFASDCYSHHLNTPETAPEIWIEMYCLIWMSWGLAPQKKMFDFPHITISQEVRHQWRSRRFGGMFALHNVNVPSDMWIKQYIIHPAEQRWKMIQRLRIWCGKTEVLVCYS